MSSVPRRTAGALFVASVLGFATLPLSEGSRPQGNDHPKRVAEGTYKNGPSESPTNEHWVLSRRANGEYLAEGVTKIRTGDAGPHQETEILNYRIEMDSGLHPSLVELHTVMDYPSYACKMLQSAIQCAISFEPPDAETSGTQNASLPAPFDLFGFHSYGWILASIVGRLPGGKAQTTVRLFLPNEDRYPDAKAEVHREASEAITVDGKTLEAQRFKVVFVMSESERYAATVWTSRSGLCLRVQSAEGTPVGFQLVLDLVDYKQTEPFVPEFQPKRNRRDFKSNQRRRDDARAK